MSEKAVLQGHRLFFIYRFIEDAVSVGFHTFSYRIFSEYEKVLLASHGLAATMPALPGMRHLKREPGAKIASALYEIHQILAYGYSNRMETTRLLRQLRTAHPSGFVIVVGDKNAGIG